MIDSFGTPNSGTLGHASGGSPAYYFAPLELPQGATILDVCLDARDTLTGQDLAVSLGSIALSSGDVTEIATTFTSGSFTTVQRVCNGGPIVQPPVDNASNVYFLRARMASAGTTGNHWLLAVRVKYSVTAPLP